MSIDVQRFESRPRKPRRVRLTFSGETGVIAAIDGQQGVNLEIGGTWIRAEWIYLDASKELRLVETSRFELLPDPDGVSD